MMKTDKNLDYYMNLDYPMEIQKIPDDLGGGYDVSIPFLGKHLFHGWGKTIEDAIADLNVVKKELFERYLREGLPIPEPPVEEETYSGKFIIRLSKTLHRRLAQSAKKEGVSLNQYVITLLAANTIQHELRGTLEEVRHEVKSISKCIQSIRYTFTGEPKPPGKSNMYLKYYNISQIKAA